MLNKNAKRALSNQRMVLPHGTTIALGTCHAAVVMQHANVSADESSTPTCRSCSFLREASSRVDSSHATRARQVEATSDSSCSKSTTCRWTCR